ncbi:MAG: helix-turn-helix domain-containing protein [Symbiopectobacterium sp.]
MVAGVAGLKKAWYTAFRLSPRETGLASSTLSNALVRWCNVSTKGERRLLARLNKRPEKICPSRYWFTSRKWHVP